MREWLSIAYYTGVAKRGNWPAMAGICYNTVHKELAKEGC